MSLSKGSVVLLGSAVDFPVLDWSLVYGVVKDTDGECLAIDVNGTECWVAGEPTEVKPTWNEKCLDEMSEMERAHFHTVWSNHWVPVEKYVEGQWSDFDKRTMTFSALNKKLPLRIKPSEETARYEYIDARLTELRAQMDEELEIYEQAKKNHAELAQEFTELLAELF